MWVSYNYEVYKRNAELDKSERGTVLAYDVRPTEIADILVMQKAIRTILPMGCL